MNNREYVIKEIMRSATLRDGESVEYENLIRPKGKLDKKFSEVHALVYGCKDILLYKYDIALEFLLFNFPSKNGNGKGRKFYGAVRPLNKKIPQDKIAAQNNLDKKKKILENQIDKHNDTVEKYQGVGYVTPSQAEHDRLERIDVKAIKAVYGKLQKGEARDWVKELREFRKKERALLHR